MTRTGTYLSLFIALALTLLPLVAFGQTTDTTNRASQTTNTTNSSAASAASSVTSPYQFQSEGLFGCSYNGAYAMSVGSFAAQGGAFVPVSDATVEQNTGYLVYDQCILSQVIDKERVAVTSALVKQNLSALLTGRNGSAMFVQRPTTELSQGQSEAVLNLLKNGGFSAVDPSYRSAIVAAAATGYRNAIQPTNELACATPGVFQQSGFNWDKVLAFGEPGCTMVSTYWLADQRVSNVASAQGNNTAAEWLYGHGFYPQELVDANGNPYVTAPSALVNTLANQTVETGFNQLQSASDIGQMVNALFAGFGTQILSSNGGLTGAMQSTGSQPSYVDQMVAESSAGLRNVAVNAAITQLTAAQQIEQMYYSILSQIAKTLTTTISQIKGEESQCWQLIQQKVCVSSSSTSTPALPYNQCYDQSGSKLTIATSTVYSQAVINAQIAPLATTTVAGLNASQSALTKISQLINGVTNTTSLDAQRIALQQLDNMIANHQLHTQTDVTTLQSQQSNVSNSMTTLVQNVAQTWGDGTPNTSNPYDPNSGWCNVSNPTVVQMWDTLWKKQ